MLDWQKTRFHLPGAFRDPYWHPAGASKLKITDQNEGQRQGGGEKPTHEAVDHHCKNSLKLLITVFLNIFSVVSPFPYHISAKSDGKHIAKIRVCEVTNGYPKQVYN